MKALVVGGVRPDWINLSILLKEFEKKGIDYILAHTGQHYNYFLTKVFFEELGIPEPKYFMKIGSGTPGYQDGKLLEKIDTIIRKEKPDIAISFSDANPSLFATIASKHHVKVAHVEAGMRSNDWRMPEEKNRRIIDSISDMFFVPTGEAMSNLRNEGVDVKKVYIVGKLIVEAINKYKDKIGSSNIMKEYGITKRKFILSTVHRPENVNSKKNMKNIIEALNELQYHYNMPIIALWHPRTQKMVAKYKLKPKFEIRDPIGFFDFVNLQMNTRCTIGDSGGIEEQACWLGTPCVTLRISTERPETISAGANVVICHRDGLIQKEAIMSWFDRVKDRTREDIKNPYVLGAASAITDILLEKEEWIKKPKVWWDE